MTTRIISTYELKEAALRYYENGQLTAQGPDPKCVLSEGNRRCAIGAAMKPAELRLADYHFTPTVAAMVQNNIVLFESQAFAQQLQNAHDLWIDALESFPNKVKYREDQFLMLL